MYRNYIIIEMVKEKVEEIGGTDQRKVKKDLKPKTTRHQNQSSIL